MSEDKERHLPAVPDPETPKCMYADGEHGPCGGPVTVVGDGFDYCMNHAFVRHAEVRRRIGLDNGDEE